MDKINYKYNTEGIAEFCTYQVIEPTTIVLRKLKIVHLY